MLAPDLDSIYRIEDALEEAVRTTLTEADIPQAIRSQEHIEAQTPRVVVDVQLGAADNHYQHVDGEPRVSQWRGTVQVTVVSRRGELDERSMHSTWVARVRKVMQDLPSVDANLDYHTILFLLENGTTRGIDAEADEDNTSIQFAFTIAVRPEAWPTWE